MRVIVSAVRENNNIFDVFYLTFLSNEGTSGLFNVTGLSGGRSLVRIVMVIVIVIVIVALYITYSEPSFKLFTHPT